MTDGWERPDRPASPAVEIPLTGDGPLAIPTDNDDSTPPPNWRKVIGLASLGGVLGGIALSVVLLAFVFDDDEPDGGIAGDPTSTLDQADLTTLITTPPTLLRPDPVPSATVTTEPTTAPLNTVDTPATPTTTTPPILGTPTTYGTLPDYPRFTGIPEGGLDSFDLAPAVAKLEDDVARRSTTHLETGAANSTLEVTIVRDPINNRYGVNLVGRGEENHVVVDIDGDTTYFTIDPRNWATTPNSEVIPGVEPADLAAYFDRLMLGPLRPDTLPVATVEPSSTVFFEGGATIAREFAVEMPGDVVPEWQFYALGVAGIPDEVRPETLAYLVYVDDDGELNRVIGTAAIDEFAQLVIHRLERLHEPEIVLLPDPALVQPFDEFSG